MKVGIIGNGNLGSAFSKLFSRNGFVNFMISDIPKHINNITYCFFGVDSLGNVKSLDEWGDYQKSFGTALGGFGALQTLKKQKHDKIIYWFIFFDNDFKSILPNIRKRRR